jgi:ELWxxDGT repeat protein
MRKFSLAAFVFTFVFLQSNGFCQPFTLLKDINAGILYSMPQPLNLIEEGGLVFFKIGDGYTSYYENDGPAEGLWRSNGFADGTVKIKGVSDFEAMEYLVKVGHTLFFTIFNFNSATTELWKSDGTEAGTVILKTWPVADLFYGEYRLHNLIGLQGSLYFVIRNANGRDELWKSDGTSLGTTLIKTFDQIGDLINVGGVLFFGARENTTTIPYNQLWKTDGTLAGTSLVKDLDIRTLSYGKNFVTVDGILFFVGYDGANGDELWKSDGTQDGTIMIKDIEPGDKGSNLNHFESANGNLYFFATTSDKGNALWRSDGTLNGTVMVKDLVDNPYGSNNQMISVNGTIYFNGYDDATGSELWKSDGTESGTVLFKDIVAGEQSSSPWSLSNVDGELYFAAAGGSIWKSNGTNAGTVLLKTFKGPAVNRDYEFVKANGLIFFSALDDINGNELRKTDGTPAGTVLVKNIIPSPGSDAQRFIMMGGRVYFTAFNGDSGPGVIPGRDLYRTDGTFAGTLSLPINSTQGGTIHSIWRRTTANYLFLHKVEMPGGSCGKARVTGRAD